jgi:pyruvate dehydrogenase E2 component (dihydrolipoamide acetyltransferase)
MATKVVMEALSPTMEEGRLVEWKKSEGDAVKQGEVLAEVETDKAVMDLVARADGTLVKQVVAAGKTVPVGELVAVIGEAGEDVSALVGAGGAAAKPAAGAKQAAAANPVAAADAATPPAQGTRPQPTAIRQRDSMPAAPPPEAASEAGGPSGPLPRTAQPGAGAGAGAPHTGGRVKASPLARKIAAERGLDLGGIRGSGPQGRIVQRDLEGVQAPQAGGAQTTGRVSSFAPMAVGEPFRDVPLSQMRKTIARRLGQSIGPVPTFYLTVEIDMERVAEAREAINAVAQKAGEPKVSFNDIVVKATALALRQHPECNAWWQDDAIRYWNEVHVSMAVAIEDGLITPVIRHADQKSLRQISAEAKDLAERARARRLAPDEYTGGTFSISNLGMLDIEEFTAIINPPEAAILAIGRLAEKPVVQDGVIDSRRRMRATMSCDHRVIDGATGARFLQTLKTMLENPLALVW